MDKQHLLHQLRSEIRRTADLALEAAVEAAGDARTAADPTDRQSDSGSAVELSRMAKGQHERQQRALEELAALEAFHPSSFDERAAIRTGAIVEIEDQENGEGRTLFLAPAGAGVTLYGPDGDGHLTVVTPRSPVGRALLGQRVGDVIDVTLKGDVREWEVVFVG